jgi:hypothetical protein
MKPWMLLVSFGLLAGLPIQASELDAPSATEMANEAAELPFDAHHLTFYTVLFVIVLTFIMLALMEIGRRIGERHLTADIAETRKGLAAVDGVIFSLLGLLVAFTFYGAAERFDARRKMVIEEADAIGGAWSRLDVLEQDDQVALQALFRQYLDARLGTYRKPSEAAAAETSLARSLKLQDEIWQRGIAACAKPLPLPAANLLVPSLNEMFRVAHARVATARIHPPRIIFGTLLALTLGSAIMVGHGMAGRKSRSWTHIIGYVITMVVVIYLIFQLEYPRLGFIRMESMDQVLVELRQKMN